MSTTHCDEPAPAEPETTSTTASTTSNVGVDNDVNHVTDYDNVTNHVNNDVCANTGTSNTYVNNDNVNGNKVNSDVDNSVSSDEPSTPQQQSGTMPSNAEVYLAPREWLIHTVFASGGVG